MWGAGGTFSRRSQQDIGRLLANRRTEENMIIFDYKKTQIREKPSAMSGWE